jgi:HlyD family secretion protein
MGEPNHIFRKAALDRLSSPEQLDQLMQVTTPKAWLALATCCVLVLIAVAWGIWGSIQVNVYGRGILIKHGGVFVATAFGDGRVIEIPVKEGQKVTNKQLLVRLQVPDLELKIKQALMLQTNLENEFYLFTNHLAIERTKESDYQAAEVKTYGLISNDYRVQVEALTDRVNDLSGLGNLIDRPTLMAVSNELFSARHNLDLTQNQIQQVYISQLQTEEQRMRLISDKQLLVTQGRNNLESLTNLYREISEVRSPFDGTVVEITVKPNQLVNANTPIMSLQSDVEDLEAWIFLAPGDGKRVAPKMNAQLALASAKKEHFGMMLGEVATVSQVPATPQLMLKVLANPTLVSDFSLEGAPMYVVVALHTAPLNYSRFQWTSHRDPQIRITSGSLCEGTITLTNRSPMSLVLPWFKDSVGM